MQRVRLERTGREPLVSKGELLFDEATSPDPASPCHSGTTGHWHRLRAYRTEGGRYVVHLVQGSSWREEEKAEAVVLESPEGVLAWTEAHMPRWAEAVARALGMPGEERKGLG